MINIGDLYAFVFRGLLTEQALDNTDRLLRVGSNPAIDDAVASRLSIELLDTELVGTALRMATVYTAIASFENTIRRLVSTVLLEQIGADWWQKSVPEKIQKVAETRQAEEQKTRWHSQRGDQPLNYTDFKDLMSIIYENWALFEPYIRSLEWASQLTQAIEKSRNVIMCTARFLSEQF